MPERMSMNYSACLLCQTKSRREKTSSHTERLSLERKLLNTGVLRAARVPACRGQGFCTWLISLHLSFGSSWPHIKIQSSLPLPEHCCSPCCSISYLWPLGVLFSTLRLLIHPPCVRAQSLQSCPTRCGPMDCSPPGSPVPGVLRRGHWSG